MRKVYVLLVILYVFYPGLCVADCWYEGNRYPTGTVIGGFECGADGQWRIVRR